MRATSDQGDALEQMGHAEAHDHSKHNSDMQVEVHALILRRSPVPIL
jgi:hypothetical protein